MPIHRIVHRSLIALTLVTVVSCAGKDSPELQVRAVIEQIERAAEDRDVGDVKAHLSEEYRDAHGRGAEEAARYLRGYFIANQSIHLLTRIENLTFPTQDEARAQVLVGMLGRDAAATNEWDLAGELRTFKIALRREDGEWKVTFAEVMHK
jgi:hypothetical protein